MRPMIVSQVKALVQDRRLGAQVIGVEQGMRISAFFSVLAQITARRPFRDLINIPVVSYH